MLERNLSRRAFITGTSLSTLALFGAGINYVKESRYEKDPISLEGPIQIGKLNLSVLITGHTMKHYEKYGSDVKKAIDAFPIIIPEYFPPEYSGENGNPLTEAIKDIYRDANYFFDEIEAYCRQNKKEVWVMDPAYNLSFMASRVAMLIPEVALTMGVASQLLFGESSGRLKQSTLTRKNLLRQMGNLGFTAAAFGFGLVFPWEIAFTVGSRGIGGTVAENNLRQVIVAQLLKDFSAQVQSETQALLIYPRLHWEGIKGYLLNDEKRGSLLSKLEFLKDTSGTNLFFEGRNYVSDGSVWNQRSKIEAQIG